jgi:hypothetical protein
VSRSLLVLEITTHVEVLGQRTFQHSLTFRAGIVLRIGSAKRRGDKMRPAPSKDEILDEILLCLADTYEGGNVRPYAIAPSEDHPEEFEPLRECLAAPPGFANAVTGSTVMVSFPLPKKPLCSVSL